MNKTDAKTLTQAQLSRTVIIPDDEYLKFITNLSTWFDSEVTEYFKSQSKSMRPGDRIFFISQVKQYKESFLTQLDSKEVALGQLLEMKQMFIDQCTAIYQVTGRPSDLQIELNNQFDDIITSVKFAS